MSKNPPAETAAKMNVTLHHGDLPDGLDLGAAVAIDTETMGLRPGRDRLCLVQLSGGDGNVHLVKFDGTDYSAPNLKKLLADPKVTKLFHYGRFDIAVMWLYLGVLTAPVYCTKIASKLARTFTGYHGLKNLCRDLLGVDIDKQQQTTDWGGKTLSQEQIDYAATDVLYLHRLRDVLDDMLAREKRDDLARECFKFLPTRALLDVRGWEEEDVFMH
jgi:ribonuclease D